MRRNWLFIPVSEGLETGVFIFFNCFTRLAVEENVAIWGLQLVLSHSVHLLLEKHLVHCFELLLINLVPVLLILLLPFPFQRLKLLELSIKINFLFKKLFFIFSFALL
jgi:hypothetical protein